VEKDACSRGVNVISHASIDRTVLGICGVGVRMQYECSTNAVRMQYAVCRVLDCDIKKENFSSTLIGQLPENGQILDWQFGTARIGNFTHAFVISR
jgi:hypothetical protein